MSYPLTNTILWEILNETLDDDTTHRLVWHYLGYRHNPVTQAWENEDAEWFDAYPEPPLFVESRPATVKLTRSIPAENKQLLKTHPPQNPARYSGKLAPQLRRTPSH